MIRTKNTLIIVLLFPILILLALTIYKKHILTSGSEVILPISGYDPRDLLSGHYLIYRVEYQVNNLCVGTTKVQKGYVCLDQKSFSLSKPTTCKTFIRGICRNGQFVAGIEKYYIPESNATYVNQQITEKNASIVISVMPNGVAQVKNLLIQHK